MYNIVQTWLFGNVRHFGKKLGYRQELLIKIYDNWRNLQKNCQQVGNLHRKNENEFITILDSLFDFAHLDAFNENQCR